MAKLPQKAIELIEGKNFANIATVESNGWPHVTTVWVDREGDTILVNTAVGRKKHRNLSRDPRVSLAINNVSNPYEAVFIQGKVVQAVEGNEAENHIHKLSKKYTGRDKYPLAPGEKRVLYKIEPVKVVTWPPSK
ncbi:MAG: PPOX class F420-dependent oxidoreductase [Thermoprotei archaeon]